MHRSGVGQPHTDRADLARVRSADPHPHAGILRQHPHVGDAQLVERADDQCLDGRDVVRGTQRVGHVDDRIADQLARTVVGDVAASLHRHEFGAHRHRVDPHVDVEVGPRSVGEDVWVLQQEEVVGRAVLEQHGLQGQGLAIRHAPEPTHTKRTGRHACGQTRQSSANQSRVSRSCLIAVRNPAA